jgi:hypothetical protein
MGNISAQAYRLRPTCIKPESIVISTVPPTPEADAHVTAIEATMRNQ